MATSTALRAAVVGVGAFGRHHARIYGEMADQGVRLVGLVDIDPAGPGEVARRLGVPLVPAVGDLPEPVDLVSVAVPTTVHRRIAEPLLLRGVHCLVEKPIAGSTHDAGALVRAAQHSGACLQVGLVERFNPVLAAVERLGEPPLYIEAHRLAPLSARNLDVGVVLDLMIHDLDILHHLVREEAACVSAVGVTLTGGHEDLASARLTFPSGCVAHVTASRVSQQRTRTLRIFTQSGYLSLDYDRREARIVRPTRQVRRWARRVADLAARPAGWGEGPAGDGPPLGGELLETEWLALREAEPLKAELEAAVRRIRGRGGRSGAPPGAAGPVSAEGADGLRALRLAERILADIRAPARAPAAAGEPPGP